MSKIKPTSKKSDDFDEDELDISFDQDEQFDEDEQLLVPMKAPQKELTAEIISFREKNKQFQATNEHDTYLILSFSTKDDKEEFLENINMESKHTIINGYKLAARFGIAPSKPKFKLAKPLSKN